MPDDVHVLLSEDDDEMREYLAVVLRRDGYSVTTCADGASLIDHLGAYATGEEPVAIVISDIKMPGLTGLEVLDGLSSWDALPPVVLITAFGDADTHARARALGARAVIDKPFDAASFLAVVRSVVDAGR